MNADVHAMLDAMHRFTESIGRVPCTAYVHPDDIAEVRRVFADGGADDPWFGIRIIPNPHIWRHRPIFLDQHGQIIAITVPDTDREPTP